MRRVQRQNKKDLEVLLAFCASKTSRSFFSTPPSRFGKGAGGVGLLASRSLGRNENQTGGQG